MTDGRTAGSCTVRNSGTPAARTPGRPPPDDGPRGGARRHGVYTGKKAPMAMSVTLDSSPIFSHRISSGTHASEGTARIAPSVDPKKTSQTRARPVTRAQQQPQRGADGEPQQHPLRRRWHVLDQQAAFEQLAAPRARPRRAAQLDGREPSERRGQLPRPSRSERQDRPRCR